MKILVRYRRIARIDVALHYSIKITGCEKSIGPPCHTKFDLFSIVLGKSDETMPYRLDLGNSFGVVYIAVTYLVQELC